jgi:cytochrome c oxidase subunit 2
MSFPSALSVWGQILFNEGIGFFMLELDAMHDYVMIILVAISYLLTVAFFRIFSSKFFWATFGGSQALEFVWTVVPAFILLGLAIPSLRLLYILDEGVGDHSFRIKVIGHQ